MSIFKAYDIRGVYGQDLTEEIAEKIGRAFATFVGGKRYVVGRDIRHHSEPLSNALIDGLRKQGADVCDLGICSTPINYFANGTLGVDGSIMVTASHNPKEWNGFKLCREDAIPISGATGIKDIEKIVESESYRQSSGTGTYETVDMNEQYYAKMREFCSFNRRPKIAVDYANAMGIVEFSGLSDQFEISPLYDELDGDFPNHEANPLNTDTLDALQRHVRAGQYDFGVAFDGDADRCGFVDDQGEIVTMDLTTALIAEEILSAGPATILYDLRSSWVVKEIIEAAGGTAVQSRVGHAFIKNQMREQGATFAGELAGHYYFKENFTAESSALAVIMIAKLLQKSGKTMSEAVRPLRKYYSTGEINSKIADTEPVLRSIKESYQHGRQYELDGISTEFDDWWFNVRKSNTEPLIRLILEAKSPELMAEKRDELLAIIRG